MKTIYSLIISASILFSSTCAFAAGTHEMASKPKQSTYQISHQSSIECCPNNKDNRNELIRTASKVNQVHNQKSKKGNVHLATLNQNVTPRNSFQTKITPSNTTSSLTRSTIKRE